MSDCPIPCTYASNSGKRGYVNCAYYGQPSSYGRCMRGCHIDWDIPREQFVLKHAGLTIRGAKPRTNARPTSSDSPPPKPGTGVGDHLHHMLARLGHAIDWIADICTRAKLTRIAKRLDAWDLAERACCKCRAMREQMNRWGSPGCTVHMDTIVKHMEKQAKDRNLPFKPWLARLAIRWAIRRAEKAK